MNIADLWRGAAILSAPLLAGCATDHTVYYAPPPGLTPDRAVSIIGSKDPKSLIGSSEYHLAWRVDGVVVRNTAYDWDKPILVTAGEPHRLSLAYGWGGISGGIDVVLTGEPGSTVVVEGEAVDPDSSARLWLADARTGAVIGEKHPVQLSWGSTAPVPPVVDTDIISLHAVDRMVPMASPIH
jgi:hypothetical protein